MVSRSDIFCSPVRPEIPKEEQTCEECGKLFNSKKSLYLHMRNDHQGECKCVICIKTFTQKNNLERHMKTIHRQEKFGNHLGSFLNEKLVKGSWKKILMGFMCFMCTLYG